MTSAEWKVEPAVVENDLRNDLLQRAKAVVAKKKLRHENPYVLDLIKTLLPHRSGLSRRVVVSHVWKMRQPTGLPMPKAFENTVQSAFNQHSSQSLVFLGRNGKPEDDLFFSVGGKGSGIWAVHRDRAEAWARQRPTVP